MIDPREDHISFMREFMQTLQTTEAPARVKRREAQASTRPRGFIQWKPRSKTALLVSEVKSILDEYRSFLPMTIRQIFYRLVATTGYEKTEKGYSRLCETLNRARRARLISFDAIRDDGFHRSGFLGWEDVDEAKASLREQALQYTVDRQRGQESHLVVWCEARGMVPQLEKIAMRYSVPVYSSGGFDSVTVKHDIAHEFSIYDHVKVLHIGDHDPSGVHVFGSLDEDVSEFLVAYGGDAEFIRLAVTPEHIEELGLPTAPPKATDRRSFSGMTCQAEALPPDTLARILEDAITSRIDLELYDQVLREEDDERHELLATFGGIS